MGRTKGSTSATKVVKSDSGIKDAPRVGSHGYTPEETEAAFFLFMEDQKKKEPGLKLSDAVGLWIALPIDAKNEYRKNARKLFEEYEADKKTKNCGDGDAAMVPSEGWEQGLSSGVATGVSSGVTSAASVATDHGLSSVVEGGGVGSSERG